MGKRFSEPVQTGCGAHPASYTMGTGSFSGVKRPGRGVDYPLLFSTEVKERVGLYLYSTSGPLWPVLKWTFPFTSHNHNNFLKVNFLLLFYTLLLSTLIWVRQYGRYWMSLYEHGIRQLTSDWFNGDDSSNLCSHQCLNQCVLYLKPLEFEYLCHIPFSSQCRKIVTQDTCLLWDMQCVTVVTLWTILVLMFIGPCIFVITEE